MFEGLKEFFSRMLDTVKGWFGMETNKDKEAKKMEAEQTGGARTQAEDGRGKQEPQHTVEQEAKTEPEQIAESAIPSLASYDALKTKGSGQDAVPGFAGLDHYPYGKEDGGKKGLNFQALEFPALAEGRKAWMLGNNQAFFFIRNPKGNENPAEMQLDTGNLKALLENIYDHKTQFTLMVDGNVLGDPAKFVDSYQALRPEQEEATRRAMLGREAELIGEFLQGGGIRELAREVIAGKDPALSPEELDAQTESFLQKNFRFERLRLDEPLKAAVWEVEGREGPLCAKQLYETGKGATERAWQLGTQPELGDLRAKGHEGAKSVIEATRNMHYQRLLTAYKDIQDPRMETQVPGYAMSAGYPDAFQANLFPLLAGEGGEAKILGANQAYYFTRTDRNPDVPAGNRVTQDTSKLEELMGNVYDSKSSFTLMLDGDAIRPRGYGDFADKYLKLRPEPVEEARAMQGEEHRIMQKFFREGGIRRLATKVIMEREGAESPNPAIRQKVDAFLEKNFHVQTVEVDKAQPLDGAVWEADVKGQEGTFCAKQVYSENTQNTKRGFHLGSAPQIERLSQREDEVGKGAETIRDAVADMNARLAQVRMLEQTRGRAAGRG